MTLTLTRALEIDIKLIAFEEEKALLLARRLWEFDGRPIERQALCRSLERILTLCQREGIRYPAILLRRKKELERGSWAPDANLALPEEASGDPKCPICRGLGYTLNPGGLSGRTCECYVPETPRKTRFRDAGTGSRLQSTRDSSLNRLECKLRPRLGLCGHEPHQRILQDCRTKARGLQPARLIGKRPKSLCAAKGVPKGQRAVRRS
jgi:hypothetical protein